MTECDYRVVEFRFLRRPAKLEREIVTDNVVANASESSMPTAYPDVETKTNKKGPVWSPVDFIIYILHI